MCFWTGRYESKHRIAKGTTESAKNFINISSTLSVRQQMRLASKYYTGFCDTSVMHIPDYIMKREDLKTDSELKSKLLSFMGIDDFVCKEIVIHGQQYKSGDVIVTQATDRSTLEVGVIQDKLCWKLIY